MRWTDETVAKLRELWTRGDTAREIGYAIGCSRSAVLGKKMRLGLEGREDGGAAAEAAKRAKMTPEQRKAREQRRQHRLKELERRRLEREAWATGEVVKANVKGRASRIRVIAREGRIVEPLNLPFMDLDRGACRYPTLERDGQQFWCGRPQEHGTSYCDDCCRVVFTAEGYERVINKPAAIRQPTNGRVAKPFRMPYELAGVALEAPRV